MREKRLDLEDSITEEKKMLEGLKKERWFTQEGQVDGKSREDCLARSSSVSAQEAAKDEQVG